MRLLILIGWLLVPVGFAFYHYGPGQDRVKLDDASQLLSQADALVRQNEHGKAVELFDRALQLLPKERVQQKRQVRLEKAKAQMLASQLPEAHKELGSLCDEVEKDASADPLFVADVRSALAQSQYYMTWLLRLEGYSKDVWEPEIESARQTYRLLAEQAQQRGDTDSARTSQEDLEAAVRLARLDLGELQGLPLPSQ